MTDTVSEMQRLAGIQRETIDVLAAELEQGEVCDVCGRSGLDLDSVTAAAWLRVLREQRTLLGEMERLGLASRVVELEQRRVDVVVGMLLRALETPGAGLAPDVRGVVLEAFVSEVRAARGLSGGTEDEG